MLPQIELKHLVLGSASPRRNILLREAGFTFEVLTADMDESFPKHLKAAAIPEYLSKMKADFLASSLSDKQLLITADTIVWHSNKAMNKPSCYAEACEMLHRLSGKKHEVYTGVTLTNATKQLTFSVCTKVWFKTLSIEEIEFYVNQYKPYDKAGSYGAQDWIGLVGIQRIDGSYFNVMGLPVKELYEHLIDF